MIPDISTHTELDSRFERQAILAAHKLKAGRVVANPLLEICAWILLRPFNPRMPIPGCSNGARRYEIYVGPRRLPRGKNSRKGT